MTTQTAPAAPVEWFDALAHTVTTDGDRPRCAECGEYGSHEQHQPEALTETKADGAGTADGLGGSGVDAAVSTDSEQPGDAGISAPMVAALEDARSVIRVRHPGVPAVVIVLGGGSDGRAGMLKLGHFTALHPHRSDRCRGRRVRRPLTRWSVAQGSCVVGRGLWGFTLGFSYCLACSSPSAALFE